jgi:tripartite-type tricarboxylate transporter receptor subunit TctC
MKRMEALPDVPAINEFLPGYEGSGWAGVGAPRGTPAEIIGALHKNINAIIAEGDSIQLDAWAGPDCIANFKERPRRGSLGD